TVYAIVGIRVAFLAIHLLSKNETLDSIVDNHLVDLGIQVFFLIIAIRSAKQYIKPISLAIVSLVILIAGNFLFILPQFGWVKFTTDSYYLFLNLEAIEVVIFAVSMGYRHKFLKGERDGALMQMVESLQESERLKDNINKELEKKVAERTLKIQEMNELLKTHNIQLKSEVISSHEARVFQKNMDFQEFQKTFPDDQACYEYLAKLKWKPQDVIKCRRCGFEQYTMLPNHTIRCNKCSYIESVTNGTLFHHLKFSLQKAFYITYLTCLGSKEASSVAKIAKELGMRAATVWTFKRKVVILIETFSKKKKHKDGWSHLLLTHVKPDCVKDSIEES
ncbi:MAG TPA: hypothetical protein VF691_11885, partial [Cytophagaceae bacterium]